MLKNVSSVDQVIKYDGRQYPVAPGATFDVKSMAPIGAISDHEGICIEEKWESETGRKLVRIAPEAPKKASEASPAKEPEKAQPAQAQATKPIEKDPDGKPVKPQDPAKTEKDKNAASKRRGKK